MPLESPLPYNMYLLNLRITNHILIKIYIYFFDEHFTNMDLEISEIKPDNDAKLDLFCKDSRVYGSGCGTAGDKDNVLYVYKARCKDLYSCRLYFDAGGHEEHIQYLHICKKKDLMK